MCHKYVEPVLLREEGEYNFNVLKEIRVTESYLGLDQAIRRCLNERNINDLKPMDSLPLLPCSGLIVSSFTKSAEDPLELSQTEVSAYDKYMKWFEFPPELVKDEIWWKNKLRFVRIYFATPTFDRITKDRSAKFEDMLSSIGGTMGLLTGFSIISGVEILYFTGKTIFNLIARKKMSTKF